MMEKIYVIVCDYHYIYDETPDVKDVIANFAVYLDLDDAINECRNLAEQDRNDQCPELEVEDGGTTVTVDLIEIKLTYRVLELKVQ